jgi:NADH-quinone oxidoreductase subunit L
MMIPLYFLAAGAVLAGWWGHEFFGGEGRSEFWESSIFVKPDNDSIALAHHVVAWAKRLPTYIAVAGIVLAWLMYMKATGLPAKISRAFKPLYIFFYNKWFFDELYNNIGVIPAFFIGRKLWKTGDGKIIDGLGPDGVAAAVAGTSRGTAKIQTGYVYHYAFAMLAGVVVFVTAYIFLAQR